MQSAATLGKAKSKTAGTPPQIRTPYARRSHLCGACYLKEAPQR